MGRETYDLEVRAPLLRCEASVYAGFRKITYQGAMHEFHNSLIYMVLLNLMALKLRLLVSARSRSFGTSAIAVEKALDKKLKPVIKMLADSQQRKPSFMTSSTALAIYWG